MTHYITYPMWSNPRYKVISILSTLATFSYALVWTFNFVGYNSSLPGAWLIISFPLLISFCWSQTLAIGEATFFYTERFFGFCVVQVSSADLDSFHIREEKKWCCMAFTNEDLRIVTDFYHNKRHAPSQRSPFGHEGILSYLGQ